MLGLCDAKLSVMAGNRHRALHMKSFPEQDFGFGIGHDRWWVWSALMPVTCETKYFSHIRAGLDSFSRKYSKGMSSVGWGNVKDNSTGEQTRVDAT